MDAFARFWNEYGFLLFMLAVIAVCAVPSILRQWKYDRSPEYEARAQLISRRMDCDRSGKNIHEVYYGSFETDFGQIVQVQMPRDHYYLLKDGAWGQLRWKGGRVEEFREERK